MSNPFNAAILILTEYFEFGKGLRNSKPEVDAAIRVLDAASKGEYGRNPYGLYYNNDFKSGQELLKACYLAQRAVLPDEVKP